jgi:hypothetical protein
VSLARKAGLFVRAVLRTQTVVFFYSALIALTVVFCRLQGVIGGGW